jgi:hypothetical protein
VLSDGFGAENLFVAQVTHPVIALLDHPLCEAERVFIFSFQSPISALAEGGVKSAAKSGE